MVCRVFVVGECTLDRYCGNLGEDWIESVDAQVSTCVEIWVSSEIRVARQRFSVRLRGLGMDREHVNVVFCLRGETGVKMVRPGPG